MHFKEAICVLVVCIAVFGESEGRLEPTPLVDNGLFKLQNQHDGRFLTEGSDGQPRKAEYGGSPSQKFRFVKSEDKGEEVWTLLPLSSNKSLTSTLWKISYVGHGKYQFKSSTTGLCLQASGTSEGTCSANNPLQRWFADVVTAESKSR